MVGRWRVVSVVLSIGCATLLFHLPEPPELFSFQNIIKEGILPVYELFSWFRFAFSKPEPDRNAGTRKPEPDLR
jgi:hypothetical protein